MGETKLTRSRTTSRVSKFLSFANSIFLLIPLLLFQITSVAPANAVACSTSAAAQNNIRVTPSHGNAFYIDSGVTPKLDAGYVGYIVTNTSGSTVKNYWVELSSFTGGVISLANPDDKYMELDNMGAAGSGSESATAYVLLKATNATSSAQTHTVKVWNKRPDLNGASALYECTYTFSSVKETIKAASNKVIDNGINASKDYDTNNTAIDVSDTTPELGQNITISVEGETGNIGQGGSPDNDVIWLTPAAISSWPTRSLKLIDVTVTFEGDNDWSNTSNRKTYNDRLLISGANGLTNVDQSLYVATYTFRVIGNPGSNVMAVPVAQIASGTQMKHTNTDASAAKATLSFSTVAINYNLAKTVTSNSNLETTTVGGTTYLKVPYQLKITSTSSTQTTVDEIVDVPPSTTSFSSGSARLTDVNNSNVTLSDPTYIAAESSLNPRPMHFVGPFTVSSATPVTLTYTMLLPNISTTYTNQAYALVGDLKIGATASTIPQVTVTSTSGSTTVTSETSNVTSAVEAITNAASDVDTKTATMNATIDPNGNGGTAIFQYGTSSSLSSFTEVTATTPASGTLTGSTPLASSYTFPGNLSANTTYYFRVRVGTVYGDILSFTTAGIASAPSSTTLAASSPGTTTATLNGTINPNFTPIVRISFIYGTVSNLSSGTTESYVYEADAVTLTTASGGTSQNFSLNVTGLSNGTTYYFKIRACTALTGGNCSAGANYDGSILNFTTGRSNQTITFNTISDKTYGDSTFSVSDTSTSGLSITNTSLTTSVCTISGNTVTIVSVGTCTIRATQDGNSSYNAAPAVDQSFYVNPKTLTITADDKSKTYGASTPSMSNTISGFAGSDLATISAINRTYIGSSVAYPESSTAPSNAGTYKIVLSSATLSFSSGLATNYQISYVDGTYTISVRTLTITANDKSKTAGAANPTFNVTLSGLQGSDTASVAAMTYTFQSTGSTTSFGPSTDTPSVAGTYSITPSAASLTFTVGTSSNYSYSYAAGAYTINTPGKIADSITLNDGSVIYGETLNLTSLLGSSGSGSGSITYSINSGTGCTISGTTLTAKKGSGTCDVLASKAGDATYDPATDIATITFTKRPITIKASDSSKTFGAADPSLNGYSVTSGSVYSSDTFTITGSRASGENVATYTITPSINTSTPSTFSDSYTVTLQTGIFTINQASQTITLSDATVLYGNTLTLSTVLTDGSGSGAISYLWTGSGCSITSGVLTAQHASGTCTVTATKAADTNYSSASDPATITLGKRSIEITAASVSKVANASDPSLLGYSITSGSLVNSDTFTVSASRTSGETTGSYPITQTIATSIPSPFTDSYTVTMVNGALTISGGASQSITLIDATVIYGNSLTLSTKLTDGPGSGAITYTLTSGTGCSLSAGVLTATAASGSCVVTATKAGDGTYASATDPATITLAKRSISIKSNDVSKIYGASDPSLNGYSVTSGSVYSSDTFTVSGSRTTGETVASYTITPVIVSSTPATFSDYYTITYLTGTLTIDQASQSIALADASLTYGNTLTLSTILTNGPGSGSISYSLSGVGCSVSSGILTALQASGSCTVTATKASDTNYSSASDPATITLGKRSITITASSVSKVANDADPSLLGYSITSGSLVNSDTFTVSASRAVGETAGTYSITQSLATSTPSPLSDSYTVTLSPGTLTITGGTSQTITFTMSGSKTYGSTFTIGATSTSGLPVTLTPSGGGCTGSGTTTISSDSIVVTAAVAGTNNCIYTATQAGNDTYAAAPSVQRQISITTATLTITADNKTITEGESSPTFTSSLSGLIGSDAGSVTAATYTFTGTGGTTYSANVVVPSSAGTYSNAPSSATVVFTSGSSSNYSLSYVDGTYTISALSSQTISLDDSTLTYNTTLTLSLSSAGSGTGSVTYTLTSGAGCSLSAGVLTALSGTGTCLITAEKAAGGGYSSASDTATITLAKADQTITFTQPSSLANGSSATLSYSTSSGLTVSITNNSSAKCSVSGTTVTGSSVGTCDLTASQSGNSNYNAATSVNRTFSVTAPGRSLQSQSISLSGGTLPYLSSASLRGTGYSGAGSISYSLNSGNCSISGDQLTAQASSGSCIVTVTIAADSTYNSASNNATFTLVKANQVINFTQPRNMLVGESRQSLTYSASSGLPVTLSNNSSGICSVYTSGTDPEKNGTCSITASQGGNANYNPAASVTVSYSITSVVKKQQNLVFNQPAAMLTSDPGQKLFYFSMTTVPINVTVNTPSICDVRDGFVYPISAGQCSITVSQNGTVEYEPASITRIFNIVRNQSVAKRQYTLTWSNPAPIYEGTPLTSIQLNAEASISGTYEYTPTFGVKLPRGTYKLLVLFSPTDLGTYTTQTTSVTLIVRAGAEPIPTSTGTPKASPTPSGTINPLGIGVVTVATNPVTTVITQVSNAATVSVPTPSSSPSPTFTSIPSISPSPSSTPSQTSTPTPSATRTNTPNPNSSNSASPNSSQAARPTPTPTPTPTPGVIKPTPGVTVAPLPTPSVASATPKPSSSSTVVNQGQGIDQVTTSGKEVTVVAEEGYSGKTTVTVTVQDSGQSKKVVIPVTVLPLPAKNPMYQLLSLSKTIVHWGQSDNADSYRVMIDGSQVCATQELSCTLNKAYGQNNKVEIISVGGDNLTSKAPAVFDKSQPFLLTVVNFDTAKYSLTTNAKSLLKDVATKVKALGYKNFTIYGFTDIRGGIDNQKLSFDRATSVKNYISTLVPGADFQLSYYGPSYPVAPNTTVEGLAANRRAEIWVTG